MQLEIVSQGVVMNFPVGIFQIFVKLVWVLILLLMTSCATGTGMLVKRELACK